MPKTIKSHEDEGGQCLPREFRFKGEYVRVRRFGAGILIEPAGQSVDDWLDTLNSYNDEPFMSEGRNRPPMP